MSLRSRICWGLAAQLLAAFSLMGQGGKPASTRAQAETLLKRGDAASSGGEDQKALEFYNQALKLFRDARDKSGEADTLYAIGEIYGDPGENEKALSFYNQALQLFLDAKDKSGEADTRHAIGKVYDNLGEKQKALDFLNRALQLFLDAKDKAGQADTRYAIGEVYAHFGENQKALDFYNQALPLFRAAKDKSGEADTLSAIGGVYGDLGEKQKALDFYNQALPLFRAAGGRSPEADALKNSSDEAATLHDIGQVYDNLGKKQKALDFYNQALPLRRAVGDRAGEAITLNAIGGVYYYLGTKQKALDFYNQALPLRRAVGDRYGEGITLNNIGTVYRDLGEKQKALDFFNEALPLRRAARDSQGEGITLNSIGTVYAALGEKQKALGFYNQALTQDRAVGNRTGEAAALSNIGTRYKAIGDDQKALEFYAQALPLRRAVGDRTGEAITLRKISFLFDKSQPETAIFFAKQSVNVLQTIRRDNKDLEGSLRQSFEESIESYYRRLAGLLIGRGRLGEAEEVLNLLKDKEAADFIRRDAVADKLKEVTLNADEHEALTHYNQVLAQLIGDSRKYSALQAKTAANKSLSGAERGQFDVLSKTMDDAGTVLRLYLTELQNSFAAGSAEANRVRETRLDDKKLQEVLEPGTAVIHTLVQPNQYTAILTTSGIRKAYSITISEEELNRNVFEFRKQLQLPQSDPLPLAQALYRIMFPEALRQDLESAQVKTVLWSIDGTLRYIPIAALHDGKQYLVSAGFRNAILTSAGLTGGVNRPSSGSTKGLGFGVSEETPDFSRLPGVEAEMKGIFQPQGTGDRPLTGVVLLDKKFTMEALMSIRAQTNENKAVVHIATHFDAKPGVAENSRLLLGDGTRTLKQIESVSRLFSGVDLLTLSACSTAYSGSGSDGHEVDGLGTIAQDLGANTVIASLWSVSDAATSRLMETMYRNRGRKLGKSEALKQAQQQMASGVLKPGPAAVGERRLEVTGAPAPPVARDWTHPYYWAAFILIGNWK